MLACVRQIWQYLALVLHWRCARLRISVQHFDRIIEKRRIKSRHKKFSYEIVVVETQKLIEQ